MIPIIDQKLTKYSDFINSPGFNRLSDYSKNTYEVARVSLTTGRYGAGSDFYLLIKEIRVLKYLENGSKKIKALQWLAKEFTFIFLRNVWKSFNKNENVFSLSEPEAANLLNICATHNFMTTTKQIHNYKITKESRFEIAKIGANSYYDFAKNIRKFRIKDQQALIELAGISAQKKPELTAEYIKDFEIKDWESRYKLAQTCAVGHGKATAQFIQNFELKSEAARVEIAKLCITGSHNRVAQYIKNFEITDPEALLMLARLCAKNGDGSFLENIYTFKITDSKILLELAFICAKSMGYSTAEKIRIFGIEDRKILGKLAMICAESSGIGMAKYLQYFQIRDKKLIFEIAKECFSCEVKDVARYIDNFQLKQKRLVELAKHSAIHAPCGTVEKFDYFKIEKQADRVAIALLCAENDDEKTIKFIKKFQIEDPKIIYKIIKVAIFHGNGRLAFLLTEPIKFAPLPNDKKQKLQNYNFQCHPRMASKKHFPDEISHIFYIKKQRSWETFNILKKFLVSFSDISPKITAPLLSFLQQIVDAETVLSEDKKDEIHLAVSAKCQLITCILSYLTATLEEPSLRKQIINLPFVDRVMAYWEPQTRWNLFQSILPLYLPHVKNAHLVNEIQDYPKNKSKSKYYIIELAKVLAKQGVDTSLIKLFLDLAFSQAQNFKDSRIGSTLIQLLLSMTRIPLLTLEIKETILRKIVSEACKLRETEIMIKYPSLSSLEEKLKAALEGSNESIKLKKRIQELRKAYNAKHSTIPHLMPGIVAMLLLLDLKKPEAVLEEGNLNEILQRFVCAAIPIGNMPDFIYKFQKTFLASRNPKAIYQYTGSISKTKSRSALQSLATYVSSVLNGTFHVVRYAKETSLHLQTLMEYNPHLVEEWKKSDWKTFGELGVSLKQTTEKKINYESWLRQKIVDRHLPLDTLNLDVLTKFRNKDAPTQALLTELANDKSPLGHFQYLCLKLTDEIPDDEKTQILKELKDILSLPPFKSPEFYYDVRGLLEPPIEKNCNGLIVFNSDDPYDLLLAGTEVTGSCQRVNGNHSLNKGLLGYLMNGWNRILKVSATPDGRIKARCLLRLLWDGERPVLFRDRFYPDSLDQSSTDALNAMARLCAERLGVPLLSLETGESYGKPIHALGGPGAFEYSDASHGIQNWGKYSIEEANYLK